jgi:hypothetical protein
MVGEGRQQGKHMPHETGRMEGAAARSTPGIAAPGECGAKEAATATLPARVVAGKVSERSRRLDECLRHSEGWL